MKTGKGMTRSWTTRTTPSELLPPRHRIPRLTTHSEAERQKTIQENRELLDSLGLDPSGASKLPVPRPKPKAPVVRPKKRKSEAVKVEFGSQLPGDVFGASFADSSRAAAAAC